MSLYGPLQLRRTQNSSLCITKLLRNCSGIVCSINPCYWHWEDSSQWKCFSVSKLKYELQRRLLFKAGKVFLFSPCISTDKFFTLGKHKPQQPRSTGALFCVMLQNKPSGKSNIYKYPSSASPTSTYKHSWFTDTTANFSKSFKGKKPTTVKQSLMLLFIKYLNLITPHKHIRSFITNANSSSNLVKIQSYVSKGKGTAAQQFLLFPPATSLPLAWMLFHVL